MAFFGDLGRFFNIETSEAAQIGAQIAAGNIPGAIGSGIRAVATPIPDGGTTTGGRAVDVSAPPAGVDSPATTFPVSQTGMIMPSSAQGYGAPMQAGFGAVATNVIPGLFGQAARQLSRPGVQIGVGAAGGAAVEFFRDLYTGQPKKLVITRKMQRDIKKLFMLTGGDFALTADLYAKATGRALTEDQVVKIYTKTFKNQGPYVTKAAVRKTRSTIRKMETLCDLKDRLCPPKRRAPARRRTMSSTSITQVK